MPLPSLLQLAMTALALGAVLVAAGRILGRLDELARTHAETRADVRTIGTDLATVRADVRVLTHRQEHTEKQLAQRAAPPVPAA